MSDQQSRPEQERARYEPLAADMVNAVYKNISQDVIYITGDKVFIYLDAWRRKIILRWSVATPFGVLLSLILTLSTAEFKDRLGFTKEVWSALFMLLAAVVFLWLVISVIFALIKRAESVEEMVDKFRNVPKNTG
jgi:hypothetical protein